MNRSQPKASSGESRSERSYRTGSGSDRVKNSTVAYRIAQNIVCMEVKKQKVVLYLKLKPKEISNPPKISRDVSSIGHFGTVDFEITVTSPIDLPVAKEFIDIAYQRIGG
jgi:predicted transport protein